MDIRSFKSAFNDWFYLIDSIACHVVNARCSSRFQDLNRCCINDTVLPYYDTVKETCLTTPISNSLNELFSMMDYINKSLSGEQPSIDDLHLYFHNKKRNTRYPNKIDDCLAQYERCLAGLRRPLNETCSICIETIDSDIIVNICGHGFHSECLKRWKHKTCPNCRRNI